MIMIELAQQLVRISSVSEDYDGQRAVMDAVVAWLRDRQVPATAVQRSSSGRPWTLISVSDAPVVLFACHVDTVPFGSGWQRAPLSGDVIDGLLHGRGSVDMKGGLAAAADTLAWAHGEGIEVGLLLTSDEELGALGAEEAAASLSLDPGLVIIPEATDNKYSRGHRGAAWFTAIAHGRSAHGSTPAAGINAIRLLSDKLISVLDSFPSATDDYLGSDSANIGMISGGSARNMVPDEARATLDFRTVAGGAEIRAWLEGLDPAITIEQVFDKPPLRTDSVPDALKEFEDLGPLPYFTDASVLGPIAGSAPIVIWGPGGGDQMHTVDEVMSLRSLEEAGRNYRRVVAALS